MVFQSLSLPLKNTSSILVHELNALRPMVLTPFPITTVFREEQFSNALNLISVTLSGIVTFVNAVHPLNELLSMVVTLLGMVISVSEMQLVKVPLSIDFNLLDRVTCCKLEQFLKHDIPIYVTLSGITTLCSDVHS